MKWDNLLPSCIDCNRGRGQVIVDTTLSLAELAKLAFDRKHLFQAGKHNGFPISNPDNRLVEENGSHDDEGALLLDPTRDVPMDHLRFHLDDAAPLGLILPRADGDSVSQQGKISIHIYGLNRLGLVQERTHLLRRLEFLGDLVIELGVLVQRLIEPSVLAALDSVGAGDAGERLAQMQGNTLEEIVKLAESASPHSEMVKAWIEAFMMKLRS